MSATQSSMLELAQLSAILRYRIGAGAAQFRIDPEGWRECPLDCRKCAGCLIRKGGFRVSH